MKYLSLFSMTRLVAWQKKKNKYPQNQPSPPPTPHSPWIMFCMWHFLRICEQWIQWNIFREPLFSNYSSILTAISPFCLWIQEIYQERLCNKMSWSACILLISWNFEFFLRSVVQKDIWGDHKEKKKGDMSPGASSLFISLNKYRASYTRHFCLPAPSFCKCKYNQWSKWKARNSNMEIQTTY